MAYRPLPPVPGRFWSSRGPHAAQGRPRRATAQVISVCRSSRHGRRRRHRGVVIGIYYGRRSRKFKQVVYVATGHNLVQNLESKLDGVAITFKGNPVSTLTVSKLAIWNAGTETVDSSDLSEIDPLRIEVKDGEILEAGVIAFTSSAVDLLVSDIDVRTLRVEFDFLDHQQGGVFLSHPYGAASQEPVSCGEHTRSR